MSPSSESKLWSPLEVGPVTLAHRAVMAPLTRYRNDDNHAPLDIMVQYYADRASTPGTLIITEATGFSGAGEADANLPAVHTQDQIAGWSKIYKAVHSQGSFVFQQLWDLGRAGNPDYLKSRGFKYSSSSAVPLEGQSVAPEALTEEEILEKIEQWRVAARNVVAAGGDGVEVHGAHGYLLDQFISDSVNQRTDKWGGSVENRSRFLLEVVKAVVEEVGAERTALRLSPFATFQDAVSSDIREQYTYIIRELKKAGYKLAYISLVEPRGDPKLLGSPETAKQGLEGEKSLDFILEEWDNQSPVIVAGGYNLENFSYGIDEHYKKWDVALAFGRYFIANPDLVFRLKNNVPFNHYDRLTFHSAKKNEGYNTYEFSSEALKAGVKPFAAS